MLLRLAKPEAIVRDKPLVDDIAERISDPGLYRDVTKALLNRRAFLFQSPDFFCVLMPKSDCMLGWVAGSHTSDLSFARLRRYMGEAERLASIGGASVFVTLSVRKGWEKIYGRAGYSQEKKMIDGLCFDVWTKQV